jgi:hypothetical protein
MKRLPVFFLLSLFIGCSFTEKVYEVSSLDLDEIQAEKITLSAALIFSEDLKDHIQDAYPAITSTQKFELQVGKCLCYYLTKAVKVAYQEVTRAEEEPMPGKFDRIIKFHLKGSRYIIPPSPEATPSDKQIVSTPRRVTYILSVQMEAYDGKNGQLLAKTVLDGNSIFARGGGETAEFEKLKQAIRTAVQQVSYNAASHLISGFAESEKHLSKPYCR